MATSQEGLWDTGQSQDRRHEMVLSELKQNNRKVETLGSPVCGSANQ